LSDRSQIETTVLQFFEALNTDDASGVALSEYVEYTGMLTPEPVRGEIDVREHLHQIAPFMRNVSHGKMIIEDGRCAVLSEFDGVNNVHTKGAFFLEMEEGRISKMTAVFDTRPLMSGGGS